MFSDFVPERTMQCLRGTNPPDRPRAEVKNKLSMLIALTVDKKFNCLYEKDGYRLNFPETFPIAEQVIAWKSCKHLSK